MLILKLKNRDTVFENFVLLVFFKMVNFRVRFYMVVNIEDVNVGDAKSENICSILDQLDGSMVKLIDNEVIGLFLEEVTVSADTLFSLKYLEKMDMLYYAETENLTRRLVVDYFLCTSRIMDCCTIRQLTFRTKIGVKIDDTIQYHLRRIGIRVDNIDSEHEEKDLTKAILKENLSLEDMEKILS